MPAEKKPRRGPNTRLKLERFDDKTWKYGGRLFTANELEDLASQWRKQKPIGADLTRAQLQEIAQEMIRTESYRWCRARFFHALVGAWKQGKMQEVLDELLDEKAWDRILDGARDPQEISDNLINELGNRLVETGWLK